MLLALAVVFVVLAAAFLVAALIGAQQLLQLPRPGQRPVPASSGLAFEDVSFSAADGVLLRGWFFPLAGAPLIVYCPGRGRGLNDFDFRYAPMFHAHDYQVFMFDWRGMGASDGRTTMGYCEQMDLAAAVAYVKRQLPGVKMGAMGNSLGAAVIFLAGGNIADLAAIAGEGSFATWEGMIASGMQIVYHIPGLLARPLAWSIARVSAGRLGFAPHLVDPVRRIRDIAPRPVFIMHGVNDRHIPVEAAYALYEAAAEPKDIWVYEAGHTEGLEKAPASYEQRVTAFFDRWLKK